MFNYLEFILVMSVVALVTAFGVSTNLVTLPIATCFLLIVFFTLYAVRMSINRRFNSVINK